MTDAPNSPISLTDRLLPSLRALVQRKADDPDDPDERQATRDACRVLLGDSGRMIRLAEISAGLYESASKFAGSAPDVSPDSIDSWFRLTGTWAGLRGRAISIANGS